MARKFISLHPGSLGHEGASEIVNFPEQTSPKTSPTIQDFTQPTQSASAHPVPPPPEATEKNHPKLPHRQRIKSRIKKQKPVELWLADPPKTESDAEE